MSRIYLAGPLFCRSELEYNLKVKEELSGYGFEVVLPQECEVEIDTSRMGDKIYASETAERIFKDDLKLLESCDIVVINLDGRVPDEGACVEIGYAYAKGIPVFGLKTDVRTAEYGIDNMMISGMIGDRLAHSIKELASMLH